MLVSHRHQFIFLKTRKTAGTSLEIALSRFAGEEDVITPISAEDEEVRGRLGHRGPQNHIVSMRRYSLRDWARSIRKLRRRRFFNHIPAESVRRYVGEDVWRSYRKFTIERNPYDKAVSRYFWHTRDLDPRPPINDFIRKLPTRFLSDWSIYTVDDCPVTDFVLRYESLTQDVETLGERLGLPGPVTLPSAKSSYRPARASYRELIDEATKDHIARVCAWEIEWLDYMWITD